MNPNHRAENCEGAYFCDCHCQDCNLARIDAGRVRRHTVTEADIEDLADLLMDLRVSSPWWQPPSTITYQEGSRELAKRILEGLRR